MGRFLKSLGGGAEPDILFETHQEGVSGGGDRTYRAGGGRNAAQPRGQSVRKQSSEGGFVRGVICKDGGTEGHLLEKSRMSQPRNNTGGRLDSAMVGDFYRGKMLGEHTSLLELCLKKKKKGEALAGISKKNKTLERSGPQLGKTNWSNMRPADRKKDGNPERGIGSWPIKRSIRSGTMHL